MRSLIDVLNDKLNESSTSIVDDALEVISNLSDKDYKEFYKELEEVSDLKPEAILAKLSKIFKNVDQTVLLELISNAKDIADNMEKSVKESLIEEGDGVKKSIKELIGELFPSLSFYPALGIWGMVDQMIQSGEGFAALTPEQARLLPVYTALFFGLVGSKIAWNRLKDKIKARKEAGADSTPAKAQLTLA